MKGPVDPLGNIRSHPGRSAPASITGHSSSADQNSATTDVLTQSIVTAHHVGAVDVMSPIVPRMCDGQRALERPPHQLQKCPKNAWDTARPVRATMPAG